jgi:hydrogenase/urease accessory protein HupE
VTQFLDATHNLFARPTGIRILPRVSYELPLFLVGFFNFARGHVHGSEMSHALACGVGYVIATGMLHALGIGVMPLIK